jgi:glycosyltransferase involved in cell wall biosynthesis
MPDVSVVIPTRNRAVLLLQALRSALAQKEVSIEVLVVDDGSDDGTRASVEAVADSRVKLLVNDRSQGVASARNRGVAHAVGSWIAFLDDDDLWAPDKLSLQLGSARNTGAAWAYAGAVAVDERLRVISGGPPPSAADTVRELPFRNPIPAGASNVIVRRDLLDTAGSFDPKLRHMADWDLWIRLGRLGAPAVVHSPLVAYRVHTGNASLDTEAIPAELRMIEQRYAEARAGVPIDHAYVHRWIAWSQLRAGDRVGALKAYLRACRAGDLTSLVRATVGLVHPRVATPRPQRRSEPWRVQADEWLGTIVREAPANAPARSFG